MSVEESLQLNNGFVHVNGVAARLAARAAGAKSTNGKRTLDIEEVIVAQEFSTKEERGKSMLLSHQRRFHTSIMAVDIRFSMHLPWYAIFPKR